MEAKGGGAGGGIGEDIGEEKSGPRVKDAVVEFWGEGFVEEEAEGMKDAEPRESGVGVGEFEQADFAVSEGEAESVIVGRVIEGRDSTLAKGAVEDFWPAREFQRADGGDIEGIAEGGAEADGTVESVVVIIRAVKAIWGGECGGDIWDNRGGFCPVFESEEIGERFQC